METYNFFLNIIIYFDRISRRKNSAADGPIAQLAEHGTENAGVGGPIPPWATIQSKQSLIQIVLRIFFVSRLLCHDTINDTTNDTIKIVKTK